MAKNNNKKKPAAKKAKPAKVVEPTIEKKEAEAPVMEELAASKEKAAPVINKKKHALPKDVTIKTKGKGENLKIKGSVIRHRRG